jgi:hypothetical protein
LVVVLASVTHVPATKAQQPGARGPGATRQLDATDLKAWKSIRQSVLSDDGAWFAYVVAPNEGDAAVVIRSTAADGKELKFSIGEIPSAAGGRGGAPGGDGASSTLAISGDSRWVAYTIYPAASTVHGGAGRGGGRGGGRQGASTQTTPVAPAQNKLGLVNLATGEKKEFDRIRRFAFNGDKPTWIAMQSYADVPVDTTTTTSGAAGGRGGRGAGAAASGRPEGTDLILYRLATGEAVNVGNVAEFSFDDAGVHDRRARSNRKRNPASQHANRRRASD